MNRFQKAATAAIALTITLAGATLVTAPLALADVRGLALHRVVSVSSLAPASVVTRAPSVRHS